MAHRPRIPQLWNQQLPRAARGGGDWCWGTTSSTWSSMRGSSTWCSVQMKTRGSARGREMRSREATPESGQLKTTKLPRKVVERVEHPKEHSQLQVKDQRQLQAKDQTQQQGRTRAEEQQEHTQQQGRTRAEEQKEQTQLQGRLADESMFPFKDSAKHNK